MIHECFVCGMVHLTVLCSTHWRAVRGDCTIRTANEAFKNVKNLNVWTISIG
jgi:hypothetical protein